MNKLFAIHLWLEAKVHLKMALSEGCGDNSLPVRNRLLCPPIIALGLDICY